jgi:hypothetical protein
VVITARELGQQKAEEEEEAESPVVANGKL